MKKQRIIFRADASKKVGFGHFMRSLALASYLLKDFECIFASYNQDDLNGIPSKFQLDQINNVCDFLSLEGNELGEYNKAFIKNILPNDIVILDNYYHTPEYQQDIKEKVFKLVCIDDRPNIKINCDLLITPSPLQREDFILNNDAKFVGGIKWAMLRDSFLSGGKERNTKSQFEEIVIAMGGADAFNLTDKITSIISTLLPQAKINIIIGNPYNLSEYTKNIATVYSQINAQEIVKIFDRADLGIFPTSTVCLEAFSRLLPVIGGYYIDNQKTLYDYCTNNKLISPIGNLLEDEKVLTQRLHNILINWKKPSTSNCFMSQQSRFIQLFKELSSN